MRVQKALPRTILPAPSMSPTALPRTFPPAEALKKPKYNEPDLAVETYSQLQPPDTSALVAFAHRIGIASIFSAEDDMPSLVRQALTHSSFAPFHQSHYPNEAPPPTNTNLAVMGNSLLGLFATEHLHASYPHLPTRVLKATISAYVGPRTCQAIAKEIGAAPLLRWARTRATPIKPAVLHPDAMASVPRALTGLVYHYRSLPTARKFVHTFFLSREVDMRSYIKFRDPKLALSFTVAQLARERPISRLLRETGRLSSTPIFVVGVFTGRDKLGEGFGSSLKMAEYRACEDALQRLYLTRTPPHQLTLPTSTFLTPNAGLTASVYDTDVPGIIGSYVPGTLGTTEIRYGSLDNVEGGEDEGVPFDSDDELRDAERYHEL